MITKITNAVELQAFIEQTLPLMSVTGKARDLRKIKPDPASHGKGVLIWFGCPTLSYKIEMRVTTALNVIPLYGEWDEARLAEDLLKKGWQKRMNRLAGIEARKATVLAQKTANEARNAKRRLARSNKKLEKQEVIAEKTVNTVVEVVEAKAIEIAQSVEA